MRLGDYVQWLEYDRPPGETASVYIREGRFFRCEGDKLMVLKSAGALEIINASTWFAGREEAECSAMGWAVRLVVWFRYAEATAYAADGTILFRYTKAVALAVAGVTDPEGRAATSAAPRPAK